MSKPCANNCRVCFRACSFAFLPADIVSQILNFGRAGADRPADPRRQFGCQFCLRQQAAQSDPPDSGHRGRAHPAIANNPTFNIDVDRTRAQYVGLTERDVTNSLVVNLAGSARSRRPIISTRITACRIRS